MTNTKSSKLGYFLIALVLLLLGICFIVFTSALTVLAFGVGITLAVFGIVFATLAISNKTRGASFAFKLFFAILSIIAGVTTAIFNSGAVEVMISVFSLVMIVDASFKLHSSAISRRYHMAGWWVLTAIACLCIGGSFYLIKFAPTDNVPLVSVILGIVMILDAAENAISAFYITGADGQMKEAEMKPMKTDAKIESDEENGEK